MKLDKLSGMKLGWFIGNFVPASFTTEQFEVSYKEFTAGDTEPEHYQLIATEITLIASGKARLGNLLLEKGDIVTIPPLESSSFEALTDVTLIAVKFPSIPGDKVVGRYNG
jgi:hypothetical protein